MNKFDSIDRERKNKKIRKNAHEICHLLARIFVSHVYHHLFKLREYKSHTDKLMHKTLYNKQFNGLKYFCDNFLP